MKKNIYTYIAAATLFLTSCTDLDQSSISTIDKDNFYQNESDIKVALNGVYQVLTDRDRRFCHYTYQCLC